MTEKRKSAYQIFIDGDSDGISIDMEKIRKNRYDCCDDEFDYSQKCGLTDNIYILIGLDLRWFKRFNPKNHVIF
ncbi:MAG: hypothetical protein BZ133_08445 [Methanosphaera sp. SHI613]|nr:MAG: hypothetical protein BZ133_08445 [Methanosphaera sp. SHI613]